jgi:NADH dehydrogenase [ubiquinone] 1 alpha subcomplex assembly factor 7
VRKEIANANKLVRRIRAEGPVTVAAFMAMALHDPETGYYATRDPIGAAGDFTTAPEISQIFGELIGLWCAEAWARIGRPDPVILTELGPGRGVLMSDLLRAAATVPEFRRALRLILVESSLILRAEQQQRLRAAQAIWVNGIDELPDGPMLLVGNEFLDALPIRQFVRGARGWSERMVGVDSADQLQFVDGPESSVASLFIPEALRQSPPRSIIEISPAALALASTLGSRFVRQPGAALLFDYGWCSPTPGSTLRALRRHGPVSLLAEPGTADLSAHIDFASFLDAARAVGADVHGPVSQGRFLQTLGAGVRLAQLLARAAPPQCQGLETGLRRLIDPGEMGELFKAVAIVSPGFPTPIGFVATAGC